MMIGELARQAGTKPPTIRFYEEIGMLRRVPRTPTGRRSYGPDELQRLIFILHARALGFGLDEVRSLLSPGEAPDRDCAEIDRIAAAHLAAVEIKLARLERLREELARIVGLCDGGTAADCAVLDALADHNNCTSEHERDKSVIKRSS